MADRYLIGTGNRDLNNPLNWSSASGGTGGDVLGGELITNAADKEFSSDTGYWTKESGISIISGVCRFSSTPSSNRLKRAVLTTGKAYKLTFSVLNYASGALQAEIGVSNYVTRISSNGTYMHYLIATSTDLNFRAFGVSTFDIDNVSVQEVLTLPTASDNALIDNNSGTGILTQSAEFNCFDFIATNSQTLTIANSVYNFKVWGSETLNPNLTINFTATAYWWRKNTDSRNITMNGCLPNFNRYYFDGLNGETTLQDNFNIGQTTLYALSNHTFNTNDKNLTFGRWSTNGIFIINASASIITCIDWNLGGLAIFNKGTSTVILQNTAGIGTITSSPIFHNLTLKGINAMNAAFTLYTNITIQNTLSLPGNNSSNYRLLIASSSIGTPRTITCNGSIIASNVDFRDITLAGTANRDLSNITGGSGDCGGNSGITFTSAIDCYINHTSGAMNVSDVTKWVTTDGGTTQARVPLMQDRAWGTANSFTGTATVNMNCPRIGSIDLSGVNKAVTWSLSNNIECYGNYVLGENVTQSGNFSNSYLGAGSFNINTYNKQLQGIAVERGIYSIISNCKCTSIQTRIGQLILGNNIIELNTFYSSSLLIYKISGTINCEGSTIYINPSSGIAYTISIFGGVVFNNLILGGNNSTDIIFRDNNTFNELIIDAGKKVRVTGGSTQIIKKLTKLQGANAQITSTNTTPYTFNYPDTSYIQTDGIDISYCNATPANKWYMGKNSTDGGNNTGLLFRNYLLAATIIMKKLIKI